MARSSPMDKYTLVKHLRTTFQEVVAVTDDGTKDATALQEADISLAMGTAGTEVAKESADVINLDDSVSTIVTLAKWGRSVYVNIQKFVQFQLTVNAVALIFNFSSACLTGSAPLTAVQLLWINKSLPNHTTYKKHPPLSLRPNTKTHTKKMHTCLLYLLLLIITAAAVTADASGGSNGSKKGSSGLTGMVVGLVIGVTVFLILLCVFCECYAKKRNQKRVKVLDLESGKENKVNAHKVGIELGNVNISFRKLEQVTDNFSKENILGRGGFGVVYKGKLDGKTIAVKRMNEGIVKEEGLEAFKNEIAGLTKAKHIHLVALLGYCVHGQERLLVFEYMPRGTLTQHLFEFRERETDPLSWNQRFSIALDVGRGVQYLHSFAPQSIIHRDLKPSNILLGDNMQAKVADFGLVKIVPHWDEKSIETRVAGTPGYIDPKYIATGKVTKKADVYAFGVVLMELIAGRKMELIAFKKVLMTVDKMLAAAKEQTPDIDEETLASIRKVAELAVVCTANEPNKRPNMDHAVNVLGPLVKQWEPSRPKEDAGDGNNLNTSLSLPVRRLEGDEGTSTLYHSFDQTQSGIVGIHSSQRMADS